MTGISAAVATTMLVRAATREVIIRRAGNED